MSTVRPIKLPLFLKQIGSGVNSSTHRSGWPYCLNALKKDNVFQGASREDFEKCSGLLLDDFVERTFKTSPPLPWSEPWVGIFHHPQNIPDWWKEGSILKHPAFLLSRKKLIGAIAMSEYLADYLREELEVPVACILHASEVPSNSFNWELFCANKIKKIVQIGFSLRNFQAIYQVNLDDRFEKIDLRSPYPWVDEYRKNVLANSPHRNRPIYGQVNTIVALDDQQYDKLLSESIVLLELFDCSASNTVIECIARNTPIVVNQHPALEQYLGKDYPLFFNSFEEISSLLNEQNILKAHNYLCNLNKDYLDSEQFRLSVQKFLTRIEP